MKKFNYIFILLFAFKLQAQPPSKFYQKFGGSGIDIGYGIRETFNRQYIICGSTSTWGFGGEDAFLLLIDSMGQNLWSKTYGGVMTDVAKNLVVNPLDSGFIFTGNTNSIGNGGYDIFVVRTDKNGNVIWQKTFGGFDWDFGNDIVFAPDGNIVVCGYSYNSKYGKSDGILMKINTSNGAQIWQKNYGGLEDDDFRALKLTPDNFFILTGETKSYNDIMGDIYFFKTDLNGDSITYKTQGLINKEDYGNDIIDENINDYFITGGTESYSFGMKDAFICKTTNSGDSVWLRNYGKPDYDEEAKKIILSKNIVGRYLITHSEVEFTSYKRDVKTLFLDANGYYIKGGSFGGYEDDEFFGLTNTSVKGFIGVGCTKSYGSILEDIYLIKYDSLLDIAGDIIGIKVNQKRDSNIHIYPTLVNEIFSDVNIETLENFTSSLIDVNSKEISTEQFSNNNTQTISLKGLPSGLYILTIKTNSNIYKYKILKQ